MFNLYFKCIKKSESNYVKLRKVLQMIKKTFLNNDDADLNLKKIYDNIFIKA